MTLPIPRPFKISVSDSALDHLHQTLDLARLPDELDDVGWDYGAPLSDVKRLTEHWTNGFNWREEERRLNETLPQFTLDVEVESFGALNIHFVHQTSEVRGAIPLLFIHGWPGSFLEVAKILPLLSDSAERQPSFHVVAPSLVNFGFSEGVKQKGFDANKYAEVLHKLMLSLGYDEYVVQGGDWGALLSKQIAVKYGPKHCKALHTNFPLAGPPIHSPLLLLKWLVTPYTADDRAGLARQALTRSGGQGYYHQQGSKPQTLGYSLASSPVGLLAWMYEKLHDWTDDYPWTDDEVLTWVSIYWFSRAGPGASTRIYYEMKHSKEGEMIWVTGRPTVPMGISVFPKEIFYSPPTWRQGLGNVVYEKVHNRGGHFAAHEQPELLAGDLRAMFGAKGPAFTVVPGKSGYD